MLMSHLLFPFKYYQWVAGPIENRSKRIVFVAIFRGRIEDRVGPYLCVLERERSFGCYFFIFSIPSVLLQNISKLVTENKIVLVQTTELHYN